MYCIRMLSSPDKHHLARDPYRQKDNLTKHNTNDISVHCRLFFTWRLHGPQPGLVVPTWIKCRRQAPVLGRLMSLDEKNRHLDSAYLEVSIVNGGTPSNHPAIRLGFSLTNQLLGSSAWWQCRVAHPTAN